MRHRSGYTIIELLIAMAIGAGICSTAFAAVRTLSEAMTAGGRMSVENALMREGVVAGLDDLDTWRSYDDPAGDAPLRSPGDPFSPLPAMGEDFNLDYEPVRDPAAGYEEWWRRDSRTWFRCDPNIGVWGTNAQNLGDYSLFGYLDSSAGTLLQGAEQRWHHRLVHELAYGLGYLALIDHLPASEMYAYYDHRPGTDQIFTPGDFRNASSGGIGPLVSTAWLEDKAHDFVCLLTGTFFTIIVPSRATTPAYQDPAINRAMFQSWYDYEDGTAPNPGWSVNDGYDASGTALAMLPLRPSSWPEVGVRVRHYAANARQFHSATVVMRSPVSGQVFKLYLTYSGTTLRGARRQRGLEGAWP